MEQSAVVGKSVVRGGAAAMCPPPPVSVSSPPHPILSAPYILAGTWLCPAGRVSVALAHGMTRHSPFSTEMEPYFISLQQIPTETRPCFISAMTVGGAREL